MNVQARESVCHGKKLYRRSEIIQHKSFYVSCSKFRHSNHRIGAHTCANHTVPYGTALLGWRCPRHFVPGYDRTVPPGHFATASSYNELALMGFKPRAEILQSLRDKNRPNPLFISAILNRSNIGSDVSFQLHFCLLFCVVCFTPMRFPRVATVGETPVNPQLHGRENPRPIFSDSMRSIVDSTADFERWLASQQSADALILTKWTKLGPTLSGVMITRGS